MRSCCASGPSALPGATGRCERWSSGCCGSFCAAAFSSTGTSSHNRYYHCVTRTPSEVKVTRRHHPLQGQSLEVLHTGPRQLVVRAPDGLPMRLPRAWTDADGATEAVAEGAVFSVDAIRALVERVEALQRRRVLDVIEAGGACLGPEGGTHGEASAPRLVGGRTRGAVAAVAGEGTASRD